METKASIPTTPAFSARLPRSCQSRSRRIRAQTSRDSLAARPASEPMGLEDLRCGRTTRPAVRAQGRRVPHRAQRGGKLSRRPHDERPAFHLHGCSSLTGAPVAGKALPHSTVRLQARKQDEAGLFAKVLATGVAARTARLAFRLVTLTFAVDNAISRLGCKEAAFRGVRVPGARRRNQQGSSADRQSREVAK